jgi:hypothetical protein
MNSDFVGSVTKVWYCRYCEARNVTAAADVFSDQCENCTRYNEVDWTEAGDVTLSEAKAVADGMEAN